MPIASKSSFGVALMLTPPFTDECRMNLMLARNLGWSFASFDFAHHLELEFFGESSSLESHISFPFVLEKLNLLSQSRGAVHRAYHPMKMLKGKTHDHP